MIGISEVTRFHEAGHAVAAVKLGIGVGPEGIKIKSDHDAYTHVCELPIEQQTEEWCIRRAGVRYSGPMAESRYRTERNMLSPTDEARSYDDDFKKTDRALQDFQSYRKMQNHQLLAHHRDRAEELARECIASYWSLVLAVAEALKGRSGLSKDEICAIVPV